MDTPLLDPTKIILCPKLSIKYNFILKINTTLMAFLYIFYLIKNIYMFNKFFTHNYETLYTIYVKHEYLN